MMEAFDKYGFAGVIVVVLGWFMLRMENVIKDNTLATQSIQITMVKICEKLGVKNELPE